MKKNQHLKDPLSFLHGVAKDHKVDFVVGFFEENGDSEDVCYFGHEEGKPDIVEIANYLGL